MNYYSRYYYKRRGKSILIENCTDYKFSNSSTHFGYTGGVCIGSAACVSDCLRSNNEYNEDEGWIVCRLKSKELRELKLKRILR